MALFIMIIRKMTQNKWLVVSLFIGILISVGLVSSMPIYSEAILSRMLVKDLEQIQNDSGIYSGTHYSYLKFMQEPTEQKNEKLSKLDQFIREDASPRFGLPVQEVVTELVSASLKIKLAADPEPPSTRNLKTVTIRAFSEFEEHIQLKDGRMPAAEPVDGVYEVLVTEQGLNMYKAVLDTVFSVEDDKVSGPIKLKPVGVFEKKNNDDPYFRNGDISSLNSSFIIPEELAARHIVQDGIIPLVSASWFIVLDYSKMELRHVDAYISTHELIYNTMLQYVPKHQAGTEAKALKTISDYEARAEQLRVLMWALNVPVLTMLGFYMFMVSHLIASRQKNEIAVLRSRGAARWQIIASYLVEGIMLCGLALLLGPMLGVGLTEVLGASNGFLEFVQRVRLPVRITEDAIRYGAIAAAACLIIMIIPVIAATRVSIVNYKQQMARQASTPLWHKMFLDVIALGLAFYGYYIFNKRHADLQALGLNATDLNMDPLQFVVPALFIMGGGLLLLRLYPWLLRLIYWVGKKWWPPSIYATLIQVGRSSGQYQFLMIFLIMTIATGVFSASAARTINSNIEDRIQYGNGADIVLTAKWVNDAPPPPQPGESGESAPIGRQAINYVEPPFEPFENLPGVEHAARVFKKPKAEFFFNGQYGEAILMGIDTDQFGRTAWFRDTLLDYSINNYLNLIAGDTKSVLISKTLAEQRNVKPGDTIYVGWEGITQQLFTVFGVIEYFPTFNPNPEIGSVDVSDKEADNAPMLIVGHLPRVQVQLALEPYDVWLKLSPNTTINELYEGIKESRIDITRFANTRDELVKAKNDPFLLALNGILTLGFVMSILISFAGFLLYWILSMRGRTLQNGVMRAIGLSLRQLIAMLSAEQLLTSGVAVVIGIVIGNAASRLYVPGFQSTFNPGSLVPPFIVEFAAVDFIRIYVLVGAMLVIGLGILAYMLSRMRIHQALKLGED